ncbi:hypothetical protein MPH_04962 [Macrophomina phaseolina MS6]|uniref:Uncharacterized protein n=1 Tax=Macrophomina phaseolina (strain MS6) TaxID=1126212 RepID=K2SM13_MACPH|nr:hypothetical protein MPH_04962 [Macrophomina phaseolina MS6]
MYELHHRYAIASGFPLAPTAASSHTHHCRNPRRTLATSRERAHAHLHRIHEELEKFSRLFPAQLRSQQKADDATSQDRLPSRDPWIGSRTHLHHHHHHHKPTRSPSPGEKLRAPRSSKNRSFDLCDACSVMLGASEGAEKRVVITSYI